jgi:chemotaxis response regulator CheB
MAQRAQSTPLRVLIADDSKPIADMLTELITERGRVEVIGVGESEDGVVRAIRDLKPTRLLVTSNHVSEAMRAACMELGADSFWKIARPRAAR